jgi:hypothetical protein
MTTYLTLGSMNDSADHDLADLPTQEGPPLDRRSKTVRQFAAAFRNTPGELHRKTSEWQKT